MEVKKEEGRVTVVVGNTVIDIFEDVRDKSIPFIELYSYNSKEDLKFKVIDRTTMEVFSR